MLLRFVSLGSILFATQAVSADDTSASSNPSIRQQANACPTHDVPATPQVQSNGSVGNRATNVATHDGQQRLLQQKCAEMDRLRREITRLRAATGTAHQILVRVQMLEVSLSKLREMGMVAEAFQGGYVSGPTMQKFLDEIAEAGDRPLAEPVAAADSNDGLRFVEWLKQNSLAKVISEPNLVTVSGQPASVHIGGQFPVPVNSDSKPAVDFHNYGTELDVLALALGDNQVRLEVDTKVSAVDDSRAIEIDGVRIPGLRVRQCNTEVELSFAQTAVLMTGLVDRRTEARQDDGGQIVEVPVDLGLMVVITSERVSPIEMPTANANRATRK